MSRPNILIIFPDQHRWDCIGAFGNKDIKTPNVDSIAEHGVSFSNCFCPYPVCTPSRYSFITGLYPHQHMGLSNHSTIAPNLPTFPKILKESGYSTKAVGKMHYTPTYIDVGFEEMVLAEQNGPGRYDDDYHRYLKEKGLVNATDLVDQVSMFRKFGSDDYKNGMGTISSNLNEEDYSTGWIGENAMEEINSWEQNTDKPHLLMVGFIAPHHPHDVPEPWASMYNPDTLSILPGWTEELSEIDEKMNRGFFLHKDLTESLIKKITAKYYGAISMIDHQIGQMIIKLKEMGQYDNTLIIYTADHGDYMGYHHMCLKSNYMYDALAKIPLIVKYPNSEYAQTKNESLVSLIDVTGLILETAECMVPQSMWNTVESLEPKGGRDVVICESISPMGKNGYMIRTKTRKLLYYRDALDQFFDLEKDPYETNNLIDNPEYIVDINKLLKYFTEWMGFTTIGPLYLHEMAPVITQENVPDRKDDHRKEITQYLQDKMDETFEIK